MATIIAADTMLANLEGVGGVKLAILNRAGLERVRDIRDVDLATVLARIETAAAELCAEDADNDEAKWGKRCELANVVARRVKHADASPIHPPHLICSLYSQETGMEELFIDPVVTSAGQTYEKYYLLKWLQKTTNDPPNDPYTNLPLRPLNDLPGSKKYFVNNIAVRNAVEFYKRHSVRFNMLLKKQ